MTGRRRRGADDDLPNAGDGTGSEPSTHDAARLEVPSDAAASGHGRRAARPAEDSTSTIDEEPAQHLDEGRGHDYDQDQDQDDDPLDDPLDGFEEDSSPAAITARRRRRRRRALIALSVVGALVLAGCVAVGGYIYSLQNAFTSQATRVAVPTSTLPRGGGANYLLLGSDRRDPEAAQAEGVVGQRSDVMMLVHVSEDRRSVHVISFPRDLDVEIPGHGRDRINAALAYGGVPLATETVSAYTGVPIDHVALIDFDGIQGLVDSLGGVDVVVDQSFEGDGIQFTAGVQHMDGATALTFVRQRKQLAEGDFARNRHQQALLSAILGKIISGDTFSSPGKVRDIVDVVSPFLTVDSSLTPSAIARLAWDLREVRSGDIHYLAVPHGDPTTTSGGASVVSTDEPAMDVLRTALKDDDMQTYYAQHAGG
ncbi:LCP family protein [Brachybacterium sp. AOP25-B2-12]|uniref:LCP family protein n=1 Tax=Brachybacterium sp. AOP25-B2-12 TaxID=3457710 RepID=UPI004034C38A